MFAYLALGRTTPCCFFGQRGLNCVSRVSSGGVLTEKAMRLYQYIGHSCELRLGPEPEAQGILKPGWGNIAYVKSFLPETPSGGACVVHYW